MPHDSMIPKAFWRRPDFSTFSANERRLLSLLRQGGALSRAELARQLELSSQAVIRIVETLLERGVVSTGAKVIQGPGQPSIPVDLADAAAFSFGLSIRPDSFTLILLDIKGRVKQTVNPVMAMQDRPQVLEVIKDAMQAQIAAAGIDLARVFGVGVAMSGFFLGDGQKVNTPRSMEAWALRDLEGELARIFDLPVWVENDGSAAAAGESLYGQGRGYRHFAFIYMDYGLGGGIVQDGMLMRGAHGNAGEFTGLLEPTLRPHRPTLALLFDMLNAYGQTFGTVQDMLDGFRMDLPGVAEWLERVRPAMTQIVSAIAAIFDPQAIVLGGRLPPVLAKDLAEQTSCFYVPVRDLERPFPKIVVSDLGGDRAAIGAAAIPFTRHFF